MSNNNKEYYDKIYKVAEELCSIIKTCDKLMQCSACDHWDSNTGEYKICDGLSQILANIVKNKTNGGIK